MPRLLVVLCLLSALSGTLLAADIAPRPNILWITCEDLSPSMIGCFGNPQATTPNLDRLAGQGVRYSAAFATAPVCSPARSCLVLGICASCTGSQNLRSQYGLPASFHGFPSYLRQAGYYCTNNVKTDYNTAAEKRTIAESWDECSAKAHWRTRKPGQPFFAVFNIVCTHQSSGGFIDPSAWDQPRPAGAHDPAKMPVPPYYPDTPIVRRTLANYHDKATEMDRRAGQFLAQLEADGVAENTIVFFFPDHGTGLPRGKRTIYDSGLQVPLMVRVPPRLRTATGADAPGSVSDRLVSFVDFAPTVLSLSGIPAPAAWQGQAFLGPQAKPPRQYVYGARDRVDEAFDLARSVRDSRFLYIRHYAPHLSWNAPEHYSDQAPMRREIARLARQGRLNAAQLTYAGPRKPVEELFDTVADPHQIRNLAADPAQLSTLQRMRGELRRWLLEVRDTGFMPEEDLQQATKAGSTPWDRARDETLYPLPRILDAAGWVGSPEAVARQAALLKDPVPSVRYWAAQGLAAAGEVARPYLPALRGAIHDEHPAVRIVAAAAVVALADDPQALEPLVAALNGNGILAARAARTLELLGEKARPALPAMQKALRSQQQNMFVEFALRDAVAVLTATPTK